MIVKAVENKILPGELDRVYDEFTETIYLKGVAKLNLTKQVSANDFAGLEVVFEILNDRIFGRLYFVENRLYIVSANFKKDEKIQKNRMFG